MKKLFAVLLALTLVLSMGTIAFAAGEGSITITNAVVGAEYSVYKMLNFTPTDATGDKGIYTAEPAWEDFFKTETAKKFFDFDETQKTVVLAEDVTAVDQDLAKAALEYAETKSISATKTADADAETVTIAGLDYGYYVIDTTVGTMCALTRANNELTLVEKNEKPDIDKFVQEDSEKDNADKDYGWGKVNDADIGQKVNYKSTVTVGLGATNYIMHDTMEAGLTFNYTTETAATDVVVRLDDGTGLGEIVDPDNYTVTVSPTDGHTFDITFDDEFIADLDQGDKFTVYYSATLNKDANIVVDGNDNTVYLTCGEKSEWKTAEHKTTTYTWKIDVLKYTVTARDEDGNPTATENLAGAVFQLKLTGSADAIKFTQIDDTEVDGVAIPTYRVDPQGTVTSITTGDTGEFFIVGLDEGVYDLTELEAPAGYNKLSAPVKVTISSNYNEKDLSATYLIDNSAPATIGVENNTGGLLPETGGIGTTIFYVIGGLLMVAAAVLLISKKRMAATA